MKIDAAIQGPLDLVDSNGVTKGHTNGQKLSVQDNAGTQE